MIDLSFLSKPIYTQLGQKEYNVKRMKTLNSTLYGNMSTKSNSKFRSYNSRSISMDGMLNKTFYQNMDNKTGQIEGTQMSNMSNAFIIQPRILEQNDFKNGNSKRIKSNANRHSLRQSSYRNTNSFKTSFQTSKIL